MLSGSLYCWLDAWIVSLLENNLEHTEGVTLYTGQVSTGSEHPAHAKMVPYSDLPKSLVAEAPQQFLSQKWTQCLCWNLNASMGICNIFCPNFKALSGAEETWCWCNDCLLHSGQISWETQWLDLRPLTLASTKATWVECPWFQRVHIHRSQNVASHFSCSQY